MEIKTQIEFVEGAFETDTGKLVCVQSKKHVDVQLCFKAGMNVPFADIKLYSRDRYVDAKGVFDDAVKLGDEIVKRWNRGPVPECSPWGGVDRMTVSIYAIMALYEHGHITEGQACNLMNCSDIVSFRIRREQMFREMCAVLSLPLTSAPLPHPGSNVPYQEGYMMLPKALTAENGAKAALMGEFYTDVEMPHPDYDPDDGDDPDACPETYTQKVPVTWITIKAIWAKAVEHFTESSKPVPCAACDRGDFQLGHAEGCQKKGDQ